MSSNIFPPDMYAAMADEGWGNTMEDYRESDAEMIERVKREGGDIDTAY